MWADYGIVQYQYGPRCKQSGCDVELASVGRWGNAQKMMQTEPYQKTSNRGLSHNLSEPFDAAERLRPLLCGRCRRRRCRHG